MKLKTFLLTLTLGLGTLLNAQKVLKTNFNAEYSPKFMSSGNSTRMATNFKAFINGLNPGETYYYFVTGVVASDINTVYAGAGGSLFYNMDSATKYAATPDFNTAGSYDSFTVSGPFFSQWFGFVNNTDSRYTAGNYIYPMISIKSASLGSSFSVRFALNDSIKVLDFNTSAGANNGTGIYGLSKGSFQEMVLLYDSALGDKHPLSIAMIEDDMFASSGHNAPTFYNNNVDGKAGAWGTIIPNTLAKGIRRIDRRKFDDHSLLHSQRDTNGVWFTIDTKNPSGGSSTPIKLTVDEAALVPTEVNFVTPFVTINESQDSFTVIVQRKYSTEDTAKITVSLVGGTATDGLDFNFPGNQVLTFAPGALRSDSFKFNIIDDLLTEGDEVVTLKLIDPVNTTIGASPTLSLTIVDNDVPIIKFVDKVIVTREGLGNVIGRIAIENGTASVTSIHAAVQSKSALTSIPGEFYLSINDPNDTLVRFSNGLSKDTFKMMGFIVDDAVIDAPDTIYIVLRNPSGTATIGADSVLMIIVKDDDAPPGVRFIGSSLTVNENIGNAKVQVEILNRNNNPSDFSLKYIGSRSTTTEGSDLTFNPTSQIFTFGLTGSDTMTINIPIIDDTNFEMDEVAVFAVEGTVNNTTLKPDTFRITINSDDAEKLTISAASAINITTGVITRAGDKVIVSGIVHGYNRAATGMQFTVIDATGGIQISSALKTFSYTVKEGDSISVQGIVSQALGVAQLSSLDTIVLHKTGLATYSPAAVTKFDENSEQEIVVVNNVRFTDVSAWPTAALSANGEAFAKAVNSTNDSLIIRIDAEGPLNGTPAPSKALYYKITGIGSQNDNTTPYLSNYYIDPSKLSDVAVINSPKLSFAISTLTVVETSDSTPAIQVNIANSGFQNVSFKIDSNTGTARVPLDFTFTPISLSFLPSVSSYSFQVNLSDDADKDGDKTIILVLRNPGYGVLIGTDSILTITISDNETGIKTLNPSLVKVYPNPSNGMIYLETKKIISSVKIYNMNGLEIENSNENTNFVSLKNQASGIYQLILEIEGELYTTRVQKN